jgi:hypothetical protein
MGYSCLCEENPSQSASIGRLWPNPWEPAMTIEFIGMIHHRAATEVDA